MEKKRKYLEEYLKFGFTTLNSNGIEKPQCVLCKVVLSHESMKPSKLKRHFETKHSEHTKKDLEFFRRHETSCKSQRLDRTGIFQQSNTALMQASYEVALEIAKQKKPHTIGENLIKPCMLKMVKLVLGESSEAKMQRISLSNNTIQRRISDMSVDVKEQILNEIKASPIFSFQVDESTDISSCAQLLVLVKYIHSDNIKEEFLFCSALESTTKSEDIMEKINTFFVSGGLEWDKVCGVCTDGAPSMLGSKSGFQNKVKQLAPQAKGVHCMIHRYALASKTLPIPLQEVLDSVIRIVNYIKSGALNTRLFKELCKDMDSDHEVLLFYTAVRWLSKGNVVNRVFELKDEIKLFLEVRGKHDLLIYFNDKAWLERVAYLADILEQQNKLNLKLQGKETNIIEFHDNFRAFLSKLQNWRRKINLGNIAMFEKLCSVIDESEGEINENLTEEIAEHLESLTNELERYFPELKEEETRLIRNPFSASLDVTSIPDELQDEFLDLRNDSSARDLFSEKLLNQFWCIISKSYPNVAMLAFRVLVPFVSTYLCESGFSTLLNLKTKTRNQLNVEHDMRLALTKTHPRILRLVNQMQFQPSH